MKLRVFPHSSAQLPLRKFVSNVTSLEHVTVKIFKTSTRIISYIRLFEQFVACSENFQHCFTQVNIVIDFDELQHEKLQHMSTIQITLINFVYTQHNSRLCFTRSSVHCFLSITAMQPSREKIHHYILCGRNWIKPQTTYTSNLLKAMGKVLRHTAVSPTGCASSKEDHHLKIHLSQDGQQKL